MVFADPSLNIENIWKTQKMHDKITEAFALSLIVTKSNNTRQLAIDKDR